MPVKKGTGGKNRRKGKTFTDQPKDIILKGEGQEYAQIIKSTGNGFMDVLCFSQNGNVERRAHIRGCMRKKVWMGKGDVVLVSVRNYQDETCDILLKYNGFEIRQLKQRNQIPKIDQNNDNDEDNNICVYEETASSSDDERTQNTSTVTQPYSNTAKPTGRKLVAAQNRNLELPSSDSDSDIVYLDDI